MLVRSTSRYSQYGFFTDPTPEWNSWCDRAADIWPDVGRREELRAACKVKKIFAPWDLIGKLERKLPAEFSTDPKIVAKGAIGAIVGGVTSVVDTVVVPATKATEQAVAVITGPKIAPEVPKTAPSTPGTNVAISTWDWPQVPKSSSVLVPVLAVAGLGIAALILTRRKGGALAGYSKRVRSRRRRSRR